MKITTTSDDDQQMAILKFIFFCLYIQNGGLNGWFTLNRMFLQVSFSFKHWNVINYMWAWFYTINKPVEQIRKKNWIIYERFSLFVFRVILVHLIFIFKEKNQRKHVVKSCTGIYKKTRSICGVELIFLVYLPYKFAYKFNICLKYL